MAEQSSFTFLGIPHGLFNRFLKPNADFPVV